MPFPVCIRQTLWEICLSMCSSSGFLQGRTWPCSPWISNSCGWKIYTRLVKKCWHKSELSLQSYTERQLLVLNAFLFSRQPQIRHWNHCYSSHKTCLESCRSGVYRCCSEHGACCSMASCGNIPVGSCTALFWHLDADCWASFCLSYFKELLATSRNEIHCMSNSPHTLLDKWR